MPDEIERKFLVIGDEWKTAPHKPYTQGYLSRQPTVRVRRTGDKAFITIKGETQGVTRKEFEYAIPTGDAEELFKLCIGPLIEKTRFVVEHGGKKWEVDEFHGDNAGLVVAEIELKSEDEAFEKPQWLGREVSDDARYCNASLSERPFKDWKEA